MKSEYFLGFSFILSGLLNTMVLIFLSVLNMIYYGIFFMVLFDTIFIFIIVKFEKKKEEKSNAR